MLRAALRRFMRIRRLDTTLAIYMDRLRDRLRAVPHVVHDPEPLVQVLSLNQAGVVLSVRPFCHHDHYWQVYFDANQAIVEVLRLESPA